jgi:hypothetical protein
LGLSLINFLHELVIFLFDYSVENACILFELNVCEIWARAASNGLEDRAFSKKTSIFQGPYG